MGFTSYSVENRSLRSETLGYTTNSFDTIFTQNQERRIHESMSPVGVAIREARDSDAHPTTIPIILNLDVTGSMGSIPHELIKTGLPKMMSSLIQNGVKDAALLFTAIGDHEVDSYPLQIGQFESGDEELDMWLTRTYVEGGGGANIGESYLLAWYFAAFHTEIDSLIKRNQKGFLFTIGDEPGLEVIPEKALKEIFGDGQYKRWTDKELLEKAREKYHVFHLFIERGWRSESAKAYWDNLLGQDNIIVDSIDRIPELVSNTILKVANQEGALIVDTKSQTSDGDSSDAEEML